MPRLIVFLSSLVLAMSSALAAETIALDSRNLKIGFEVRALGLLPVSGHFTEARGELMFDPLAPSRSRIAVSARSISIQASSAAIEERLRSPAFFDAARHPVVTFESTAITVSRQGKGYVRGQLRMRGHSRPLQLRLQLHGWRPSGQRMPLDRLQAVGTLQRSNWGMTALPSVVGDEVRLDIEVRLDK